MNRTSLVGDLISDRRIEEFRENIQDVLNIINSHPKVGRMAAHVYVSLAGIRNLAVTDAARLSNVSDSDFAVWKGSQKPGLGISGVGKTSRPMGIYKDLVTMYSGNIDRVSTWFSCSNRCSIFDGKTPYELLVGTRAEVFCLVRHDLAADTV